MTTQGMTRYAPDHVRLLVRRGERQFEQAILYSEQEGEGTHVALPMQAAVHDTVAGLTKLFRDHVPGAADAAGGIARAYAKGVDARAGRLTVDCVRTLAALVRAARERYLPEAG